MKAGVLSLSTPHGTLGTWMPNEYVLIYQIAFNSTRYIRNVVQAVFLNKGKERLSTPHGALGTVEERKYIVVSIDFQLHTVH